MTPLEELKQHLNCKHEIVGQAVVTTTHLMVVVPVCENCTMTVYATTPAGALWRN